MRRWLLILLCTLLAGCAGGGSAQGGTAAPAPGPAHNKVRVQLEVAVPEAQSRAFQARAEILTVTCEIFDPAVPDTGTLSGRRTVATGTASVPPGARSVKMLLEIVPGNWQGRAFGLDAEGHSVALSRVFALPVNQGSVLQETVTLGEESPTALSLSPLNQTIVQGSNLSFQAFANGLEVSNQVTWTSSDASVATIDGQGLATGVAPGGVTITASGFGTSTSTSLSVRAANLTSLTLSATPLTVGLGTQLQLSATGTFEDGSTQDLTGSATWSSNDSTIASVISTGLVTGNTVGTTQILATFGGQTASVDVTVTPATLVSLDTITPGNVALRIGGTQTFTVSGTFSDGTTSTVAANWTSSDSTLVSIDMTTGLATALAPGTVTITATSGALSTTTNATVASFKLIVVNSGDFTMSTYAIDELTGIPVATPLDTIATGVSPTQVAVTPDGQFLYVADNSNQIFQYALAPDGTMTALGPFGDPRFDFPDDMAITNDTLVVLNSGVNPNRLLTFNIDRGASPGQLSFLDQDTETLQAFDLFVSPASRVYVTPGGSIAPGEIGVYDLVPGTGLTNIQTFSMALVPGVSTSSDATMDPLGRYLEVFDATAGPGVSMHAFQILANGFVAFTSNQGGGDGFVNTDMTTDALGRFLYLRTTFSLIIQQWVVANQTTGALSAPTVGPSFPGAPVEILSHPNGTFLYVLTGGSPASTVDTLSIDQATGVTTNLGAPINTGNSSLKFVVAP